MNTLSWMIYLAEVVENISNMCVAMLIFGSMAIIAFSVFTAIGNIGEKDRRDDWKQPLRFWWVLAVAAGLSVIMPSSAAVYMIAASEVGEAVLEQPESRDVLNDLQNLIRKKLKDALGETASSGTET